MMKRVFRRVTCIVLVLCLFVISDGGQVYGAERVLVQVDVLTDHSAKITLKWSDGSGGDDLMIAGWTFGDDGLTVAYQTGVSQPGFNSRTVKHDSYTFPMAVYLEQSIGHTPEFTDLTVGDPGYEAILNLYYRGVISGYPDGSFKAANPVKRSEFSKMLMTTAAYETLAGSQSTFTDVADSHWAKDYIMTLSAKGIVNGKGEGIFDPEGQIKVGEVLAVLTRTFELYGDAETYPHFLPNHWSNTYFLQAVADGVVTSEDAIYSNYDAEAPASRELCAVLLSRVLENLHDVTE